MNIFDNVVNKFRKFNAIRREKNLESLLARSREFGDRLEAEAKRFGIDLRVLKTGNYYEALGIKYTADHRVIKEAYHELIKKHHPDVSKDINAEEMTKAINEAYSILKDRKLKDEYDRNFSKGKTRISADAAKGISLELMRRYTEVREKDFDRFRAATSVPLQRDTLRAEIEEVCNWNRRFDKAAATTFRDFRNYGKRLQQLGALNKKLLQEEKSGAVISKLRENGRRLEGLILAYGEIKNGMSIVTANVKKEISTQETTINKRLRALV